MDSMGGMDGPAQDGRDSSEVNPLPLGRGNASRPNSFSKNGRGLTIGDGMVNGLGLTNMSPEPMRFCPPHANLYIDNGLTNGLDLDCEGLKTDRALINGISLELSSDVERPKRRLSQKGRRHKAMMERVKLRSEIPIDEVGGR